MKAKLKKQCEINEKIALLQGIRVDFSGAYNWAEDMNWATYLLEKFAEEVSFSKCKGKWHIDALEWSVSNKSFPMAICLAFIKWEENKENKLI